MEKQWLEIAKKYSSHIRLEKRLATNTVMGYMRDVEQFADFIATEYNAPPRRVSRSMIESFLASLYDLGVEKATQARMLSAIKSLFNYLTMEELVDSSPAEFIEGPKLARKLPDVLSIADIDLILETFDDTFNDNATEPAIRNASIRNAAMVELMYSCGLRVSELTALRLGDLFFDDGFIRIIGKGNKQRLVPVSDTARMRVERYLATRSVDSNSDQVFLSNRKRGISRVSVFNILKEAVARAGIRAVVSPHTLRHSFATHLLEGGASIRQVQELLGHESILTTEIYTHLDTAHLRRTIDEHHPLSKLTVKSEK